MTTFLIFVVVLGGGIVCWLIIRAKLKANLAAKIEAAVNMVKAGLYERLVTSYSPRIHNLEDAKFLAASVVNKVFGEKPNPLSGKAGSDFLLRNEGLINAEVGNLREDVFLREVLTQAVRMHTLARQLSGKLTPLEAIDHLQGLQEMGVLNRAGESPTPETFFPLAIRFYQSRSTSS
jgi:hypothetical protein